MASPAPPIVSVDYSTLCDPAADLSDLIARAFGPDGLGLILVEGVPHYSEARRALLPLASQFANLPASVKAQYEDPASYYSFGWSHGKEQMSRGRVDTAKGSYYNNPTLDIPFAGDTAMAEKYPSFARPNIWPAELPALRLCFQSLGGLIVAVGAELAKHIDRHVHSQLPSYPPTHLYDIVTNGRTHKGRLLHYFPSTRPTDTDSASASGNSSELDSWCGFHNDHSSLTGLTAAIYVNEHDGTFSDAAPDPVSGLHVKARNGQILHVHAPPSAMIFQSGETLMIKSGAVIQATPHAVRASPLTGISRATFACFMGPQPTASMALPHGVQTQTLLSAKALVDLPPSVPPLDTRWKPEMAFAEFGETTLKAYLAV